MFVAKKEEMVPMAQTHAMYNRNALFPNGSRAATKWRKTTLNMGIGPKIVD